MGIIKWSLPITPDPGNNCLKSFMAHALQTLWLHCDVNRCFQASISSRQEWLGKINKSIFYTILFSRWLGTGQARVPRSWTPGIKAAIQGTALIYQQCDSRGSSWEQTKPYIQDLWHRVHQPFLTANNSRKLGFLNHCLMNCHVVLLST